MATVNKDFKIKSGLIVEGTTATVNGYDVLTKKQDDQDYIVGLIGGTATPDNTPDTVVKRDANGSFAADTVTANTISIPGAGSISEDGELLIAAESGEDIRLSADDVRVDAVDDFRVNVGGDILLATSGVGTNAYVGSIDTGNEIVVESRLDAHIGDATVDGTAGNTVYDRIFNAKSEAIADAAAYTDGRETAITSAYQTYADQAETDAKAYTDTRESAITTAYQAYADTAEQDAKDYADDLINDASSSSTEVWSAYKTSTEIGLVDTAAQGYANSAESDANAYTDGEIATALTTAQGYADTAEANANAYTDNAVSGLNWKQAVNLLYDAAIPVLSGSGASQLIVDGHDPLGDSDSGYRVLITQSSDAGIYVFNSTAGSWTLTRADDADEFGELIGSAVYVMEGTQYGSTSWVQSNHYITNFSGQSWTQFSGQGSVTAGTGITVDGLEVSINRTTVDNWYDEAGAASAAQTAAEGYADSLASNYDPAGSAQGAYDNAVSYVNGEITTALSTAQTYADNAESDANIYTDNAITYLDLPGTYDAIGSAATAEQNAKDYADTVVNGLDTDDVEEGVNNLYFTDSRAKTSAADLLTGATLSNITITGNGSGLTITAENGVAGSTTDDLAEGSTNLYFTDQRAVDAVSGSNIQPESVDITWVRREEATWTEVPTASKATCHSAGTSEGSMKYLVRVTASVGGTRHSHVTEVLATVDGSNGVAVVEYGTIYTSAEPLATVTVEWNASTSKYDLNVTTANNSSEVMVAATLLATLD